MIINHTATSSTLPNGLKLISYPHGNNPIVCLQIHVRVGSVYEDTAQNGYAHFLEHLSFKSTRRFPDNDLSDYIPTLGASINAYTDFDSTCYYINLPSEQLEQGLAILAELTQYPLLNSKDISSEKDIIIEEIKQYENEPETDFVDYIQRHYFPSSNPLRRQVLGSVKSVRSASKARLQSFYNQHYHPRNAFIIACGQFDQKQFEQQVDQHFGSWQSPEDWAPVDFSKYIEPMESRKGTFHRQKHSESQYIALVLPELSELHPFSESFLISMRFFAIGKASLLHKRLVEQDKLCSSVRVSSLSSNLSGISVIMLNPVLGASMVRIAKAIREEYIKVIGMQLSADDFNLIKRDIIHGWTFDFESMENLAGSLASEEMLGDFHTLYSYPLLIEALTVERVAAEINTYWAKDQITCYYQCHKPAPALNTLGRITAPLNPKTQNRYPEPALESLPDSSDLHTYRPDKKRTENYYQYQLENGLKLVFKPEPGRPVTGFALCSDISQIMETDTERGNNFFCSAAMLYGTQKHSHEEIMRYSRYHGFNIRVIHHLDATTFRGKCFRGGLPQALDMLSEIISLPRFDNKHLQMLKALSVDSIRRELDYPVSYGFNRWFNLLTGPGSNLGPATGNISQIRNNKLVNLEAWHQFLVDPRRFALSVVGDHDPAQIRDLAEQYFGSLPVPVVQGPAANPIYRITNKISKTENRKSGQAIIHLGSYGVKADNIIENTAFHLLAQVLGGDIGSRFYRELREKHGFAYQTGFDFTSISQMGFWFAYAFCDPDDYQEALALMRKLIADVCEHGITAAELQSTKQYLVGMNRFEHESVSWMAAQIANLIALGYDADHYLNRESRIQSIDLETVAALAASWLKPSNQISHILL